MLSTSGNIISGYSSVSSKGQNSVEMLELNSKQALVQRPVAKKPITLTYPELLQKYSPLSVVELLPLYSQQDCMIEASSVHAWVILQIISRRVYENDVSSADDEALNKFLRKERVNADEAFLQVMILLKPWKNWAEFYRQGASYYKHWITSSDFREIAAKFERAAEKSPLAQSMKALAIFTHYHWPKRYTQPWWSPADIYHYTQVAKDKSLPYLEEEATKNSPLVVIAKVKIWTRSFFHDKKTLTGFKSRARFYQQLWIELSEVIKQYNPREARFARAQLLEFDVFCCTRHDFLNGYPSPLDFLSQYAKDSDPINASRAYFARFYRMLQACIAEEQDGATLDSIMLARWYLMLANFLNDSHIMFLGKNPVLRAPELASAADAVNECAWCVRRSIEILANDYSGFPSLTGYKKHDFHEEAKEYEKVNFNGWRFETGQEVGNAIYQYHTAMAKRSHKKVQDLLVTHTPVVVDCIIRRDKEAILNQKPAPYDFQYVECEDAEKYVNKLKKQHDIRPDTFILLHDHHKKQPFTVCARGLHHKIIAQRLNHVSFPRTHQLINALQRKAKLGHIDFNDLKVQDGIKINLAKDLKYLVPAGPFLRAVIGAVSKTHQSDAMLVLYICMARYFESHANIQRATAWCDKAWPVASSNDFALDKKDWAFLGKVYRQHNSDDYAKRTLKCLAKSGYVIHDDKAEVISLNHSTEKPANLNLMEVR